MTLYFTDKELQYIVQSKEKNGYGLKCKDGAPAKIRISIEKKLNAHKKWLDTSGLAD